jgi:hypothetical protein
MTSRDRFVARAARLATISLAAGGAGALLAMLYFFYHYVWAGSRQFTSWVGVVQYLVIPAGVALLLFASLRLAPNARINLALVGLSVVVSVYSFELFLRLTRDPLAIPRASLMRLLGGAKDRKAMAAYLSRRLGVEIDGRHGLELLADLRNTGIDAVPSVIPRLQLNYQDDPARPRLFALGGISSKTTMLCNESGQYVRYEADEHGFHNPAGLFKAAGIEIAALGDSYTQGYCVPSEKGFVALIRQRYPATLNLGMAGNGPLSMLGTLMEYAAPVRPAVVLWFYFEGNDLLDLKDERRSPVLTRYLEDDFSQGLRGRQAEVDLALLEMVERERARETKRRAERARRRSWLREDLPSFIKLSTLRPRIGLVHGEDTEELESVADMESVRLPLLRDVLSKAKSRVSGWGGTLYLVYLPGWPRDEDGLIAPEQQRPHVLALARDLGLPVVDPLPRFRERPDPLSLVPLRLPGSHYNEEGHRLVADEVLRVLGTRQGAGAPR